MKKYLLIGIVFIFCNPSSAQFTVDTTATSAQMVTAITAGGVVVSNVTYTGAQVSRGNFTCTGSCNLAINAGIILTSGAATYATLPNSFGDWSYNTGMPGDPDLNLLTTAATFDASVLEFDIIAVSDTVEFNYFFGSEEYNEYVNSSFNDVFGFFISGPGISGLQNIALIPGTSTSVAINNVNNGNAANGAATIGPCTNCSYFIDNTNIAGVYPDSINYDGITTVLTAKATSLIPGLTYHLKLAIADVADHIFDSGVLIEAGSFLAPAPPAMFAGGNRLTSNTIHICQGSSVTLSAPAGFTYAWSNGSNSQAINVSSAGTYTVYIIGSNPAFPIISDPVNVVVDPTPLATGTISQSNDTLYSSISAIGYTYSWTKDGLPIVGANNTWLHINENGCYEVTAQTMSGCYSSSTPFCVTALSLTETKNQQNVLLYPNPFSNTSTIKIDNSSNEKFTLTISDISGRVVKQMEINNSEAIINRENIHSGIYFYTLSRTSGSIAYNGKILID